MLAKLGVVGLEKPILRGYRLHYRLEKGVHGILSPVWHRLELGTEVLEDFRGEYGGL